MKSYLKVKIKSLAAESAIIRREEHKAIRNSRWLTEHQQDNAEASAEFHGLHHHRTVIVRQEARAAQLAYAMIRGRKYPTVEAKAREPAPISKIATLVSRYGGVDRTQAADRVSDWLKAA